MLSSATSTRCKAILLAALIGFALAGSAIAAPCKNGVCSTSSATKTAKGWDLTIKLWTDTTNYEFYNLKLHGHPPMEVDGPGNNAHLTLPVPSGWEGTYSAQICLDDRPITVRCNGWTVFKTDLPKVTPSAPGDAVPDPTAKALEDAAKAASDAAAATGSKPPPKATGKAKLKPPPKATGKAKMQGNEGATPQPQFEITADVDLYDSPGGGGNKVGTLNGGDVYANVKCRADKWCQVPGKGWVWGDFVKAL